MGEPALRKHYIKRKNYMVPRRLRQRPLTQVVLMRHSWDQ